MCLLFYCKVLSYCREKAIHCKKAIFKTSGTRKQKRLLKYFKTILCKNKYHETESLTQ